MRLPGSDTCVRLGGLVRVEAARIGGPLTAGSAPVKGASTMIRRCPEDHTMLHRHACRVLALLVAASALAGCDKCADYFIANPFAAKAPGTCPSGAIPARSERRNSAPLALG